MHLEAEIELDTVIHVEAGIESSRDTLGERDPGEIGDALGGRERVNLEVQLEADIV
jgi:hypothetical protein